MKNFLIKKELLHYRRMSFFFILCLSIGLSGILILLSLNASFKREVDKNSRKILGGDFAISSRFLIDENKEKVVESELASFGDFEKLKIRELYSMVSNKSFQRLVEIKSFEGKLNFYGDLELQKSSKVLCNTCVWIYPELRKQLGVDVNDFLKVGTEKFKVTDIVLNDPQQSFRGVSLAPRIFLSSKGLDDSKLISFGSTVSYRNLYYFKEFPPDEKLSQLALRLKDKLNDSTVKLIHPQKTSEQVSRAMNYLSDFLGLVSIVALLLAIIGAFFIINTFYSRTRYLRSTYYVLGMTKKLILSQFFKQLALLILSSFLGSMVLSILTASILPSLVSKIWGIEFAMKVSLYEVSVGLGACLLIYGLMIFPLSRKFSISNPFHFEEESGFKWSRFYWVFLLITLGLFWLMSVLMGHSLIIGSIFSVTTWILTLFILAFGIFITKSISRLTAGNFFVQLINKQIEHNRASFYISLFSLGLTIYLLSFIPQLNSSFSKELSFSNQRLPSFFLFDIQEEQVDDLKKLMADSEIQERKTMPMVRARFLSINGKALNKEESSNLKTREEQRAQRFRERMLNLSDSPGYFNPLEEEILEGRTFSGPFDWDKDAIGEISLEHRYAKRLGIVLGDILEFSLMGVPFKGKVINIRKVRWTSFNPNFFILLQSGVLTDAPKTFLSSAFAASEDIKQGFLGKLNSKFPNISVVDVKRLINRLLDLMGRLYQSMGMMTLFCTLTGVLLVFGLIQFQLEMRRKQYSLYKVLGMNNRQIRRLIFGELFFLLFSASFVGGGGALLSNLVFSKYVFQIDYALNFNAMFAVLALIATILILLTLFELRGLDRKISGSNLFED